MVYFSGQKLRDAVGDKLNRDVTDFEWRCVKILLVISEPFHILDEDLEDDLPRIKKLLKALKEGL